MKLLQTMTGGARRARARARAFTLVEVILAIGIATGILVVALVFYSQSANLRSQLITETERLSVVRLIMDRLATDLHAAFQQPQVGFTGTSDSMEFVVARAPDLKGSTLGPMNDARLGPATDLRKVYYYLTASLEGTNFVITGLDRVEEPLITKPTPRGGSTAGGGLSTPAMTSGPAPGLSAGAGTNEPTHTLSPTGPLAEAIRFARFRYWDGTAWLEAWDAPGLPPAVEINLGLDPLPENDLPDAYPYEVFRRIVVLPARGSLDDGWAGL
jgi:type II secretory pathway pseudopilin PulG